VTHSRVEARQLADKLLILAGGRLQERPIADLDKPTGEAEAAPRSPLVDRHSLAAGRRER
jgi:hypothetical protein